jgi:hypothetical protein
LLRSVADIQKIAQLLRESGSAIKCLAPDDPDGIPTRKEQFDEHAQSFARLLEVSIPLFLVFTAAGSHCYTPKKHPRPCQSREFRCRRAIGAHTKVARERRGNLGGNSSDCAKSIDIRDELDISYLSAVSINSQDSHRSIRSIAQPDSPSARVTNFPISYTVSP